MSYSKKDQPHRLTISTEIQANLYLQLSRLDEAGFPALQAFELLLKTNQKSRHQIQQTQRFLKLGNTIADSGYKAGIFNEFDKDLLQAGEVSGHIGIIYKKLARRYENQIKRAKKIKSKCYLPLLILIIALFVQPLPALISNEISFVDYCVVSIGRLLKIVFLFYIVVKLPFWLTQGKLQFLGLKNLVYSVQLKLPLISSWVISRQLNEFLYSIGMMLAAGLPMTDALAKSVNTINNPKLKVQFNSVILATQKGGAFAEALADVPEVDYQTVQLLLIGEKSGKLAKTILHHVKIEQENIDLKDDLLAEWIPRIFYFLVSLWVASSIITGNLINTVVGI